MGEFPETISPEARPVYSAWEQQPVTVVGNPYDSQPVGSTAQPYSVTAQPYSATSQPYSITAQPYSATVHPLPHQGQGQNATPYHNGDPLSPFTNGGLLVVPRGQWRYPNICSKAWVCGASCWMAWCCACFSVGQIANKVNRLTPNGRLMFDYSWIVIGYFVFLVLRIIVSSMFNIEVYFEFIWLAFCCYSVRVGLKQLLQLPSGGCLCDILGSIFCLPCFITQMQWQLWQMPDTVPGCTCGPEFDNVV